MEQCTDTVLMIRPKHFNFNPETSKSNVFQHHSNFENAEKLLIQVRNEFDKMVRKLEDNGIDVLVVEDTSDPLKYDAIFPNNWLSSHDDGSIIIYPMLSENRRLERRADIIELLKERYHFSKLYDLSFYELEGKYLEGTGSLIIDRSNKRVYAAVSPRTDLQVLDKFCVLKGYDSTFFKSYDREGSLIYHTNVMMSIGDSFVVVCFESLKDEEDKLKLSNALIQSGKEIIDIDLKQVYNFSGNCLQLKNKFGEKFIAISKNGFESLNSNQREKLFAFGKPLVFEIPTIEYIGGGSVRCMIAELFLPV